MKKILLVTIMFLLFAGVVSASSINGDYKGNPVVKLLLNGKEVAADDVPAMIYDNRTVIPIYLLKKMGATVTWDLDSYSADVKFPDTKTLVTSKVSLSDLEKSINSQGVAMIVHMVDGNDLDTVTYYTNYSYAEGKNKNAEFNAIFESGIKTDAAILEISYTDKTIFSVPVNKVRDFKEGRITAVQLQQYYKVENQNTSNSSTSNGFPVTQPTNTTNNQVITPKPTPTSSPTPTQQPTSTPDPVNIAICNNLKQNQALALFDLSQRGDPYGGAYKEDLKRLKQSQEIELAANGCK